MIDTDKYEETDHPELIEFEGETLGDTLTNLLAEVKRLRKGMKIMLDDMRFSKPEEEIEYWLDTWKYWLKEMIE